MKLVLIEWDDAFGVNTDWQSLGLLEGRDIQVMVCRSVGWLAKETDELVVVIPHLSQLHHSWAEQQGCGDMTIPKSAIRRMVVLRESKKMLPVKGKS